MKAFVCEAFNNRKCNGVLINDYSRKQTQCAWSQPHSERGHCKLGQVCNQAGGNVKCIEGEVVVTFTPIVKQEVSPALKEALKEANEITKGE